MESDQLGELTPAHERYHRAILEVMGQPGLRFEHPNAGGAMRERLGFSPAAWGNLLARMVDTGIFTVEKNRFNRLGAIAVNPAALRENSGQPFVDEAMLSSLPDPETDDNNPSHVQETPLPSVPVGRLLEPSGSYTPVKSPNESPNESPDKPRHTHKKPMNFEFVCNRKSIELSLSVSDFAKFKPLHKLLLLVGVLSSWEQTLKQQEVYLRRTLNRKVDPKDQLSDEDINELMRLAEKESYIRIDNKIQFGAKAHEVFELPEFTERKSWRSVNV
jgi:hypothetical protein